MAPSKTSGMSPDQAAARAFVSSRIALMFGFGGLLVIMVLAGIDALLVLRQFRTSDEQIRRRYTSQNQALNDIRSDVYASGTYVRDYLLEADPDRAEVYRTNLENMRKHMEAALTLYGGQAAPEEIRESATLHDELMEYWATLDPIFKWEPELRHRSGYTFLRDELLPRRQHMIDIAGKIAAMNDHHLTVGNAQVVSLLFRFQTRLLTTLVAALVLGFGMAFFSTRRILRLEDQALLRYREVAEARGQLKDLSARLVRAQEAERRTLSRELHDEIGQSLSAVLVEVRNLSAGLRHRPVEEALSHVETVKTLVEGAVRVVRNMALLLRPSMLDDLGLVPALKWQARETSKRTKIDVSVATELDPEDLPDEYKTCIYRVVQEALHNCAKHSHATTVRIRVEQLPDRLTLIVQDDGQGFDINQTKGLGLLGIHERVEQFGGSCRVDSELGRGTILSVDLPVVKELQHQ